MDDLLKAVAEGWGWKIGKPASIVGSNAFGNIIVRTEDGSYFRIIPEDLKCVHIAHSPEQMEARRREEEFRRDWETRALVEKAEASLGSLSEASVIIS